MKTAPQSVELINFMGTDINVVNAARVSFHKESTYEEYVEENSRTLSYRLNEKDRKLIGYLANHNHWTTFAHCFASFRIKTPIFIARQLGKHQVGLVWNEVSRRYVDEEPEFYLPDSWRGRPEGSVKQGSGGPLDEQRIWQTLVYEQAADALLTYQIMIDAGIAPEQARMILPQNTMTEFIWSGSMVAFARVCNLRLDPHAQKEVQDVAVLIDSICKDLWPVSWSALVKGQE